MDGVATIKALRTIDPTIRIIAASGLSANGSVAKAATLGITDFLAKPYTVEEMVRLVAKLLGHPDAGL
jgi:DNA-binding NtrC family response regulator